MINESDNNSIIALSRYLYLAKSYNKSFEELGEQMGMDCVNAN